MRSRYIILDKQTLAFVVFLFELGYTPYIFGHNKFGAWTVTHGVILTFSALYLMGSKEDIGTEEDAMLKAIKKHRRLDFEHSKIGIIIFSKYMARAYYTAALIFMIYAAIMIARYF